MCCWRRGTACKALLTTHCLGCGLLPLVVIWKPKGATRSPRGQHDSSQCLLVSCCLPFIQSSQTAHYRGSFSSQVDAVFIQPCGELARRSCCCCDVGKHAVDEEGLDSAPSEIGFCHSSTGCCSYMCIDLNSAEKTSYKSKQELCFLFPETMFSPTMSALSNWWNCVEHLKLCWVQSACVCTFPFYTQSIMKTHTCMNASAHLHADDRVRSSGWTLRLVRGSNFRRRPPTSP